MKKSTMIIWLVLASCGLFVYAEATMPPMSSLIQKDGMAYRELKAEMMNDKHLKAKLEEVIKNCDPASLERIQAEIILVVIKSPELVEEWNDFIKDRKRENRGTTHLDRPEVLSYTIRTFIYKGPMHKVAMERDGFYRTTKGSRRPKYKEVEKYTGEEVKAGIARNAAARWLVAEYLLKFSANDNHHDQAALVDAVHWVFTRRGVPRVFEKDWPVGEALMRWAMHNDKLCVAARLQALRNLKDIAVEHGAELNDTEISEFLIDAIEKTGSKKSEETIDLTRKVSQMIQERINEHVKERLVEIMPEMPEWKQEIIMEKTGIDFSDERE